MEMKIELKAAEREVELRKNQLNNVLHEVQLKQLATSFFFFLPCNVQNMRAQLWKIFIITEHEWMEEAGTLRTQT